MREASLKLRTHCGCFAIFMQLKEAIAMWYLLTICANELSCVVTELRPNVILISKCRHSARPNLKNIYLYIYMEKDSTWLKCRVLDGRLSENVDGLLAC